MKEYWFNRFLLLLANYYANARDEAFDGEHADDELKDYIDGVKGEMPEEYFYFAAGASWSINVALIYEAYDAGAVDNLSVCDDLTDMVDKYTGITVP